MAIRVRRQQNKPTCEQVILYTPAQLRQLAKKEGLSVTPLDLTGLCKILGLSIKYTPLENNLSGKLAFSEGRWVIYVNSLHHERRQRFTIAHELAHYCLHRDESYTYDDVTFHRGANYSTQELQADNFAGALLMPKDELTAFIQNNSNRIDDIADRFGASAVAVRKRADVIRTKSYEY